MTTRTFARWILSIGLALSVLIGLNLLVANVPVQARHTASLINCSGSIQACINAASDGDTIFIAAGHYTESLTLSKAVSLTGENRDTTIIHAMTYQRVLTVTGAAIGNSVVISGLTFTGGDATNGQGTIIFLPPTIAGPTATWTATPRSRSQTTLHLSSVPSQLLIHARVGEQIIPLSWQKRHSLQDFDPARDGVGGGILITNSARPAIQAVRVISNIGGYGGGLYFYGDQTPILTQIDIISNVAMFGGGLMAEGSIELVGANISNNYAGGPGGGAQISGTAVILNSHIAHNDGGGLNIEGNLTLQNTDVSFNTAGAYTGDNGITIFNGTLILNEATLESNHGTGFRGSIFAEDSRVWITNTRFLRNSAYVGGGLILYTGSSGRVVNSLFVQNSGSYGGASIHSWGDLEIIHTTIADTGLNPKSAILVEGGTLFITDTLIASHTIGIQRTSYRPGVYEDYNLFFSTVTNTLGVTNGGHSLIGNPKFIDPLHDNYRLRFDSAAIDHGVDAGVYTDLDGHPRPYGPGFDIGAYEFSGGPRYVATTGNDTSNNCFVEANPCATVQHAIDVASDGEEVLIASGSYTQSTTLDKPVSLLGANRDTTILHAIAGQRVLTVTGATISHSVVISGLTFTGGDVTAGSSDCPTRCGGGIWVDDSAQPLLSHLTVADNSAYLGGGIFAKVLNLKDSTVRSNIGGGAAAYTATVTGSEFNSNTVNGGLAAEVLLITDTRFLSNTSHEGGGVSVYQFATIAGAWFEGNLCTGDYCSGGGLFASSSPGGSITVSNTVFVSNTAYGGGGIFSHKPIAISGGRFENNTASDCGGAIWAYDTTLAMIGTEVISNTLLGGPSTMSCGAGVKASQVILDGGRFANNRTLDATRGQSGGAVDTSLLIMTDTQFINNIGALGGGALAGEAHLNGGRFEGNTSYEFGGGLVASQLSMSGTEFIHNISNLSGGGIACISACALDISNALFLRNTAGEKGGAVTIFGASPDKSRIVNSVLAGNTATEGGAAIYIYAPGQCDLIHTTIAASSFITQPAIAVLSGTLNLTDTIMASHTIAISNTGGTVFEDYNLFFNTTTNTLGVTNGGHSLSGDPKFIDPLHGDYHLQAGSAAIDHGIDAGIYTDLDGQPRPSGFGFDISAYEFAAVTYHVYLPLVRK